MKKSIKILSIITILTIGLMLLPLKAYATDSITVIPIEDEEQEQATTIVPSTGTTDTDKEADVDKKAVDDKVVEDKIAEDKVPPDAGFESNMVFIILSLVVFAVFAYIKVVKYNIE